jgi:DNA-3-methyladenine glycosylase
MSPLPRDFYRQHTAIVARQLLGKRLCTASGVALVIVETEAYVEDDPAAHSYRGKTAANAAMFGVPGTAYVPINYGIHHCLNVVTNEEGRGEAVLIRALAPTDTNAPIDRTSYAGPGRLTKTLGIAKPTHNGLDLTTTQSPLWIADADSLPDDAVTTTTRIGITKAADYLWRWYITASPYVSRR